VTELAAIQRLDEPTNHLDSDSLEELIRIINEGVGTYSIVSHDQHFIDRTADFVFEIENGKLTVYKGNYTHRKQCQRRRFPRAIRSNDR
jgi:macrolide transport system ATP-binding/permease protein